MNIVNGFNIDTVEGATNYLESEGVNVEECVNKGLNELKKHIPALNIGSVVWPLNNSKMTDRKLTYKNVKYGMLVEVIHEDGYHVGCKVHFFNKKGVLIGNYYKFMPYEKLRLREPYKNGRVRNYQRFFYNQRFEKIKAAMFMLPIGLTSFLIRWTQKYMD